MIANIAVPDSHDSDSTIYLNYTSKCHWESFRLVHHVCNTVPDYQVGSVLSGVGPELVARS